MRIVIQRAKEARVEVSNKVVGSIKKGYLLLVGLGLKDNKEIVQKMADKVIALRIFEDENQKMNLSLKDVDGEILSISQFTLYADCSEGRRPSFVNALKADQAKELYEYFNECLRKSGASVETGIFQAEMQVFLDNDGPVTIILDSQELKYE